MYLHEHDADFLQLTLRASSHFNRPTEFIVKDYFTVALLREITRREPSLVFKGGTSLSKCYAAIDRFSEDIDLGIEEDHATEGHRRRIKRAIVESCEALGIQIANLDDTRSRREYNRYEIRIPSPTASERRSSLIVETAIMTPAAPSQPRGIQSFIGEYCEAAGFPDALQGYQLLPYGVRANSLERTFCDKVFALCDYYLSGPVPARQSRHIYDLSKLQHRVSFDDALLELMDTVRQQRRGKQGNRSAEEGISLAGTLREIVSSRAFADDYEKLTVPLLYEEIPYEEAVATLKAIARFLAHAD